MECAKVLLESHADVNKPNMFGFVPLHRASLLSDPECLRVIGRMRGVNASHIAFTAAPH